MLVVTIKIPSGYDEREVERALSDLDDNPITHNWRIDERIFDEKE